MVESLLLGIPVPSIFVATNIDGRWEVVDGLQRISTLLHFSDPSADILKSLDRPKALKLDNLKKLSEFNGCLLSDLPEPIRLHFFKRSLTVTALSDKSDPNVRFDVFERLNRGGIALTQQEVRACVFQGEFTEFLREMAAMKEFRKLVKLRTAQEDDGTREELVLKFFAYLNERATFKGAVTEFLNSYMKLATASFDYEEGRALFAAVVQGLFTIVKGPVLRRATHVTPLNQVEALMVGAGEVLRSGRRLAAPPRGWLNDKALVESSTKGTNTPAMLRTRIDRARELLDKAPPRVGVRKKAKKS